MHYNPYSNAETIETFNHVEQSIVKQPFIAKFAGNVGCIDIINDVDSSVIVYFSTIMEQLVKKTSNNICIYI